ncbi:uncharacterized protein C8A04DRAFT_9029 [Dichotomopilus funicola]|uniref:Uncharacterized protein n=1 Tax=Dichotomopilus funicola TaxID=1934379 RepID=A0AAN6VAW2_9PEZI|nr:hypothetical protein C8A04DRAFT_9029 [Dichotomopilus funicola]
MSWPGADDAPGQGFGTGDGYRADRPTDVRNMGTFRGNRLVRMTPAQAEEGLKLLSVPFDRLPQMPLVSRPFGFSQMWQKGMVASTLVQTSSYMNRVLTPAEADALALYRSQRLVLGAYTLPLTFTAAAYFTYNKRREYRFPFFSATTLNPDVFPAQRLPIVRGVQAQLLWHALRFTAYTLTSYFVIQPIMASVATSSYLVKVLNDPKLEAVRESLTRAEKESHKLPSEEEGVSPAVNDPIWPPPSSDEQQQQQPPEPAAQVPPADDLGSDNSSIFDDASPVAPSHQKTAPTASRSPTTTTGSAWDRIRQQSGVKGSQEDPSGGQQTADQYTYRNPDQGKTTSQEQAQKEFDAMLERERRGQGDSAR